MNATAMKRRKGRVELSLLEETESLTISVHDLTENDWDQAKGQIEQVEKWIEEGMVSTIEFRCSDLGNVNLRFVMWVLKVVERFKWVEQRDTKILWSIEGKKSYQSWLREKLARSFDLDIKFSGFLTSGGLI